MSFIRLGALVCIGLVGCEESLVSMPTGWGSECNRRYVAPNGELADVTLAFTNDLTRDLRFRAVCIVVDDDGAVLGRDATEVRDHVTIERALRLPPGRHKLIAHALWSWRGYNFDVKSSHTIDVPSATRVELDAFDSGAAYLPDRPRARWLVNGTAEDDHEPPNDTKPGRRE